MAEWTDRPSRDPESQPYRIHRTPANKELRVIAVSEKLIGTNLHYWKGRSTPCTRENCTACQHGQVPRWKGYFQALNESSNVVQIIEVTDRVFEAFEAQTRKHGSLRGLKIRLSRVNHKPNGAIHVEFDGVGRSDGQLPPAAPLIEILERMWESRQGALPGMEQVAEPPGKQEFRTVG